MMDRRLQVGKYVAADLVGSALAWTLFYIYRKLYLEPIKFGREVPLEFDNNFLVGLIVIPLFWFGLYTVIGGYRDIFRRYRTKELGQTLLISIIGVVVIFFVLLLDDEVANYTYYYRSFIALFTLHFGITFVLRFLLTSRTVRQVHGRVIGFNTILVGGNERAMAIYEEIEGLRKSTGNRFIGFVNVNGGDQLLTQVGLPRLGKWHELRSVIDQHAVEEVIIAVDSGEHEHISRIMNELEGTGVRIKVIPDMYDILSGSVKMTSIFGTPLIEVNSEIMPAWQFSLKRIMDLGISAIAMVVLAPLYLVLSIAVRLSSPGPIFFRQERVGRGGRLFRIRKLRTMTHDPSHAGPGITVGKDERITRAGQFLRRSKLDELPQLLDVLQGHMSLVGPRPELPRYVALYPPAMREKILSVRPGITDLASIEYRQESDLLTAASDPEREYTEVILPAKLKLAAQYVDQASMGFDVKLLWRTVKIVWGGGS